MKRWAIIALGLLAACGSGDDAASSPDGSAELADALPVELEASPASHEGGSRDSGGPLGDGSLAEGGIASVDGGDTDGADLGACAGATVPPSTLACTGLYADIATKTLASGVRPYQPAVPLWSDGAQKARWVQLPPGTQIDRSNPNEWTFPVGTKVWKEFSKYGKRVETRLFQKVDSGPPSIWVHATYAWNADESAAVASGGGDITLGDDGGAYHIPTFAECEECHNGRSDHILGFEEVSLGTQGASGMTLAELAGEGLLTPVPTQTQLTIGDDGTGAAAPALAWLHVNCGVTCHNDNSNAFAYGAGMRLRLDPTLLDGRPVTTAAFDSLNTTIGVPATTPAWVQPTQWIRIVPGDPTDSLLVQLISNRGTDNPAGAQMPPIASSIVDTADVANVVQWIGKLPGAPLDAGTDGGLDASGGAGSDATTDAAPVEDSAAQSD